MDSSLEASPIRGEEEKETQKEAATPTKSTDTVDHNRDSSVSPASPAESKNEVEADNASPETPIDFQGSIAEQEKEVAAQPKNAQPTSSTSASLLRPISLSEAASKLVGAAISGNITAFDNILTEFRSSKGPETIAEDSELLAFDVIRKDISGPALFWAGYAGRSNIIAHIQSQHSAIFKAQCLAVAKQLMDYHKDLAAVSILVRNGTPAAVINEARQETALHRLVRRTKPNAALIHELLKTYKKYQVNADGEPLDDEVEPDDVDAINADGFSPLQLLAMFSRGIDGKSAAQVLLAHGADIMLPGPKGGNARTLAQNPHVRAVLGYRACPSPAIDEESKRIIDSTRSIMELPPLPDLEVEQLKAAVVAENKLNPQSATDEEKSMQMRTFKKLDKEGVEGMIRRLYDHTIQLREEKAAARRQALEPMESRRLTQDEQEAVADRLCNQSMEDREAKHEELKEKYIVEREPNPLDEEQQIESATRLCNRSLEEKKSKLRELEQRYWTANASPKKVITKEQMQSCARRLHDESTNLTRTRFEKLATKYLVREKGEFEVKDTKRTPAEIAEAGARMAQGQPSRDKK